VCAPAGTLALANLLKEAGLTGSTSDALRMIRQGAVRIDGERVGDEGLVFSVGACHLFQVGKRRLARVTVTS
jgi:tyrosyl-tRNA synthetase